MNAACRQSQGGAFPIGVGNGVDLGTGIEQYRRYLDRIVRSFLPVIFDSVCRNVVQQHGSVLARRSGTNQLRVVLQHFPKCGGISVDYGICSTLESGEW